MDLIMLLAFVFLTAIACCGQASYLPRSRGFRARNIPDGKIVGGRDAQITEAPYQVSVQYNGRHICGGSIVNEIFVITAAHCTEDATANQFTIRAGSSQHGSGGVVINVLMIHQHPSFDYYDLDYDITLLHLASPLPFGDTIAPIALPGSEELPAGTRVEVTGWGVLQEGAQQLANQLQLVEVGIVGLDDCRNAYVAEYLSVRMLCAGVTGGGKDACQGDSGGPLIANNILYGIVSWGYGCARADYPGVYASVVHLIDFIEEVTAMGIVN